LAWNQSEVKNIEGLIGGTSLLAEAANEKNFKDLLEQDYNILHFAMHALLDDENPSQSRLVFEDVPDSLEDGFLNIYELYNMNINAQLAVLSACNTGFGKLEGGEGMISLGRAFAYAGCPSVVISNWKVDDEATSILMQYFYQNLKDGLSKSEALQKAKLSYLENSKPREASPYFWGSFMVVGSNEPLKLQSDFSIHYLLLTLSAVFAFGYFYLSKKRKKRQ